MDELQGTLRQGARGASSGRCGARCTTRRSRSTPTLARRAEGGRGGEARELHRAARARPGAGGGGRPVRRTRRCSAPSVLVPSAIGPESPHALMAALAEKLNDRPRAIKEYEALIAADHTNVEAARKMWTLAEAAGDERAMTRRGHARRRARSVRRHGPHADGAGSRSRSAMRRSRCASSARRCRPAPPTRPRRTATSAKAICSPACKAEAKKEALAALEIAPSFERAQELLLNAVGG